MRSYVLFSIISILRMTIDSIKVISDEKLIAQLYKNISDYDSGQGDDWFIDPVCLGAITMKSFICEQILESINLKIGEDPNLKARGWSCNFKYINISNNLLLENLLECPIKKEGTAESYYITFGRYNNFGKKRIRAFGFLRNNNEENYNAHRYFEDVDTLEYMVGD